MTNVIEPFLSLNKLASKNTRLFLFFSFIYCLVGWVLLRSGNEIYTQLHLVLDTSIGILIFLLALFVWGNQQSFQIQEKRYLALSFAFAAATELLHTLVGIEWTGALSWIEIDTIFLRPATWPPHTYVLPIALAWGLWLIRRKSALRMRSFALGMCAVSLVLYGLAFSLPRYVDTGILGIQRPTQVPILFLWAGVIHACWQERRRHPLYEGVALMGVLLFFSSLFMLYSTSPHEKFAVMAHSGMLLSYCMLHIILMRIASEDAQARNKANRDARVVTQKL